MSTKSNINVEELRKAVNLLFDHLHAGGIQEIELRKDCYWQTGVAKVYDVLSEPTDFSIGSLFDDWESVRKLATGANRPVVLMMLKIAPLLNYIGDSVSEIELSTPPKAGKGVGPA